MNSTLRSIATLRETPGQEAATLKKISQAEADFSIQNDWASLAECQWERHLTYQHLAMSHQDPQANSQLMLACAKQAYQIVTDHHLDSLLGKAHRCLGRAYTYLGQHPSALTEYQAAADLLQHQQDPRYLEVLGFQSDSLIRTSQVEAGINLAFRTYDQYDTNPLALLLQKTDYYTYAIWRSGIFPRLVATLEELHLDYDREKVKVYLEKSQSLLDHPTTPITWGDQNFSHRKEEIASALAKFLLFFTLLLPKITKVILHP